MGDAVAATHPGQSTGAGRASGGSVSSAVTGSDTSGYTTHPFILGVDIMGDAAAKL